MLNFNQQYFRPQLLIFLILLHGGFFYPPFLLNPKSN